MRRAFCDGLTQQAQRNDFVFLTGDLGYAALETLREAMGSRFLNAGVAEQNLVGVSAGLAKAGLRPWIYSIAPFLYARPFEQIRNDLCLHRLPVVVVGNGGGYIGGSVGIHFGIYFSVEVPVKRTARNIEQVYKNPNQQGKHIINFFFIIKPVDKGIKQSPEEGWLNDPGNVFQDNK